MQISVTEAKSQLTELVRRAEEGDEIILTRHGRAIVRLSPMRTVSTPDTRRALLERLAAAGARRAVPGLDAARSQDFLYGDDGMPG